MKRIVDFINEEGTFNVTSANETIKVNITDIHPEMTFEDNSMLIFDSIDAYYIFIGNAELYSMYDQCVNIDKLIEEYNAGSDLVTDFSYKCSDVISIYKFRFNQYDLYYIQRTIEESAE